VDRQTVLLDVFCARSKDNALASGSNFGVVNKNEFPVLNLGCVDEKRAGAPASGISDEDLARRGDHPAGDVFAQLVLDFLMESLLRPQV